MTDHRGQDGYCGFCGNGRLGESGDERGRLLSSTVRTGEDGKWEYHEHPGALPREQWGGRIWWCGVCADGLAHQYQREDNLNLLALLSGYQLMLEVDPLRWGRTEDTGEDPAVHLRKLGLEEQIGNIGREMRRRNGQLD